MRSRLALGAGVAALVLGIVALVALDRRNGTLRDGVVPDTVMWFLVAWIGWAVAMVAIERSVRPATIRAGGAFTIPWKWLIALGLVLRVALVFTEPTLSDDVYRYLWEGHLVTEGVSPSAFPPGSPSAERYDIAIRAQVNNDTLASPYLPVAHALFGASAAVLPSTPWTMQILMIGFDLLGLVFLIRLLRMAGIADHRAMLYWLNPLVIVEVAHGAHLDAMIVGLGLAGVYFTLLSSRRHNARWSWGPLLVAAATLTRPLTALFAPVLWWRWSWRQRVVWGAGLGVPLLIATAFVGVGDESTGTGLVGSAQSYAETFRFNSAVYQPLETWISGLGLDDRGWNEPLALTRLIVAVVMVMILAAVFVRARHATEPRVVLRWLAAPVVAYVLLAPVLHPWYVLLLLALVPFMTPADDEDRGRWLDAAPWLLLSGLLIFSYLTYQDPAAFAERTWVRRLQWWPTLVLMVAAAARHIVVRRQPRSDGEHSGVSDMMSA